MIYLGSVLYKHIHVGFAESMALLQRTCDQQGIPWMYGCVSGDALVSRSRSIVASSFLRSKADVLLTIDSDIWFRPQDALSLVEKCRDGHDLIGAVYVTRKADEAQEAAMLPEDEDVYFHPDSEPVKAPFISTGFMAVHRRVVERLADTLPEYHKGWTDRGEDTSFYPFYMPFVIPWEGDGNLYLSEDWAFCQRAKDVGFECWLDPSIRLGHFAENMVTLEDMIRPPRPEPQPIRLRHHEGHTAVYTRQPVNGKEVVHA